MQPLIVPGTLESLASIRRYITDAASTAGLDTKSTYRLSLAVDEVATNIVEHGYAGEERPGTILVEANADEHGVTVLLEDTGAAYDLRRAGAPKGLGLPAEQRQVGGLGIYLARRSIDEYRFERIGNRNRNILMIRRDSAAREALVKYERELQIAREIQAGFLPRALPQPDGWEIAAWFEPAEEVAGDFYDAFTLTNNRRVGFVIADVCSKGVGAAIFMALVRSLIRAFARQNYSLGLLDALSDSKAASAWPGRGGRPSVPSIGATALKNALALTNDYILTNHAEQDMFATMFFGVLDPGTGRLLYVNAGHNPPFIAGRAGGVRATLAPTGPAVGILPDIDYRIEETQLAPGELLLAYTDGVTEARGQAGAFFGEARLRARLAQPVVSAQDILAHLDHEVHAHLADARPRDDITMLAVRRA